MHDLVEVYAGDVNPLTGAKAHLDKKDELETEALDRIEQQFPDFGELHDHIGRYMRKKDDESRFVYVLDKILPIINEHISESDWYRAKNISPEKYSSWLRMRFKKVGLEGTALQGLFQDIVSYLTSSGIFAE